MKELYYLLYQIKDSNIYWIVDVDIELNNNFINIIEYISKQEIYKIYRRYVSSKWVDFELNYKQFRKFIIQDNDKFIYKSILKLL
jgi:hypothetical protein